MKYIETDPQMLVHQSTETQTDAPPLLTENRESKGRDRDAGEKAALAAKISREKSIMHDKSGTSTTSSSIAEAEPVDAPTTSSADDNFNTTLLYATAAHKKTVYAIGFALTLGAEDAWAWV